MCTFSKNSHSYRVFISKDIVLFVFKQPIKVSGVEVDVDMKAILHKQTFFTQRNFPENADKPQVYAAYNFNNRFGAMEIPLKAFETLERVTHWYNNSSDTCEQKKLRCEMLRLETGCGYFTADVVHGAVEYPLYFGLDIKQCSGDMDKYLSAYSNIPLAWEETL